MKGFGAARENPSAIGEARAFGMTHERTKSETYLIVHTL
jgi:hypothetical protein